jgi:CRP-like cAMP-binding protein
MAASTFSAPTSASTMLQDMPVSGTSFLPISNRLVGTLTLKLQQQLLQHCELVELRTGAVLSTAGQVLPYAYFPLGGFISQVLSVANHPALEISLIGNEGMLGATLVLGDNPATLNALVQADGTALRISSAKLLRELENNPDLRSALKRYLYVLLKQLAQTAVCTHFHAVEPRLARWLLLTHDRAHADHFHLTHKCLADMLGVRRSAITIAAGNLQAKYLISYRRGDIRILERRGLETESCECYRLMCDAYWQLFSARKISKPAEHNRFGKRLNDLPYLLN